MNQCMREREDIETDIDGMPWRIVCRSEWEVGDKVSWQLTEVRLWLHFDNRHEQEFILTTVYKNYHRRAENQSGLTHKSSPEGDYQPILESEYTRTEQYLC